MKERERERERERVEISENSEWLFCKIYIQFLKEETELPIHFSIADVVHEAGVKALSPEDLFVRTMIDLAILGEGTCSWRDIDSGCLGPFLCAIHVEVENILEEIRRYLDGTCTAPYRAMQICCSFPAAQPAFSETHISFTKNCRTATWQRKDVLVFTAREYHLGF